MDFVIQTLLGPIWQTECCHAFEQTKEHFVPLIKTIPAILPGQTKKTYWNFILLVFISLINNTTLDNIGTIERVVRSVTILGAGK